MKIRIECDTKDFLELDDLEILQGGLKELSEDNYKKLKNQILKKGFSFPFFVWKSRKNYILDGTHRKLILIKMRDEGIEIPKLPVVYINAKNKKEAAEKLLAVTSQYAKITGQGLYELTQQNGIFEFDDFEFSDIDMDKWKEEFFENEKKEGLTDDDAVPEVDKENVITKLGDIWILGDHRVMCGDSTKIEDVEKLMNGVKADMVFTDPPYGVKYEQGKFTGSKSKTKFKPIENDDKQGEDLYRFIFDCFKNVVGFTNGAPFYVWSPALIESASILCALIDTGIHIQSKLIWKKQLVLGRADYQWGHEQCFYGYVGKNHTWNGGRAQTTVAWVENRDAKYVHPTQKPIALAALAVKNSSNTGNIVVDIFLGSGSTLIACEKTNRKCYGMELDPYYCDVIVKRWEEFTGKKAILDNTKE